MSRSAPAPEPESAYERGRVLPYSQLGDWVNHSGISDRAARVYWTLCEHLNVKRGDRAVWPAQSVIAKVLGIKRVADVAPAIDELVVIGAVEIRPDYDDTGRRVRNRYIIHETPADDYAGPRSVADFYRLLRAGDGRQYEEWVAKRRQEIADGVKRLKRERQEADTRAKEEAKRRALGGAGFRTASPPAQIRETAGRVEVRESARGGAGSRTSGVRDPAPEQDVVELDVAEQDEDLSLPAAPKPRAASAERPEERETSASPDSTSTSAAASVAEAWREARGGARVRRTEAAIAAQAAQLLADGHQAEHLRAVAAWMAGRGYTDLERAVTHRDAPRAAGEAAVDRLAPAGHRPFQCPPDNVYELGFDGRPLDARPPWCGDPDCDEIMRRREVEVDNGLWQSMPCPQCHPEAVAARPAVPAQLAGGPLPGTDTRFLQWLALPTR